MKLGLFADPHYCRADVMVRTRRPSLSLGKIREAMDAFRDAGAELCICMGDLVDRPEGVSLEETAQCMREVTELINSYGMPFITLPGNHDYAIYSAEEFAAHTGCRVPPYTVETDTHVLIFLDANYRSDYRRFDIAGVNWKDSNLPPEQLEYLQQALTGAVKPCVVFVHENLDDSVQVDHIIKNAADARQIIAESGKVQLVVQGHYHWGADRVIDGIRYLTLPAMCEGEENRYLILDI